jgi:glycosyltransferase involved in cell wall biosynthesis
MKIRYSGYLLDPTGYGDFARSFVRSLHEAGHVVSAIPVHRRISPSSYGAAGELVRRLDRPMHAPDLNIVNTLPGLFSLYAIEDCLNVGFTMCEGGKVPGSWPYLCEPMDGVLVPTDDNRRVFEASVSPPVRTLHMAAPERMPDVARGSAGRGDGPFVFLSVFEWTERKNPGALIRAYSKAFSLKDNVLLRLKVSLRGRRPDRNRALLMERIRALRGEVKKIGAPRIEIVEGSLSDSALDRLYDDSDAYVSAHRAEGWSMPIWRAMLSAIPAIATGYSGNMAYMTPENSYPVKFSMTPVTMDHPHFDRTMQWAEVNEEDLSRKMLQVFTRRQEAREIGLRGRVSLQSLFTPKRTSLMLEEAIDCFTSKRKTIRSAPSFEADASISQGASP